MMTKTVLLVSLAALATVSAQDTTQCRDGYYGENCNEACSPGCPNETCQSNGECVFTETDKKCKDNWESYNGDNKCAAPKCFGSVDGCAEGGKCVAPNYCVCGESGAQTVGLYRNFDGIEGTNCVNLRKDGLIGCVIAFIVLGVSISFCGLVAEKRIKSKNKKQK
jgi:hypothetical protein